MKYSPNMILWSACILVAAWTTTRGASAPVDVSSLANAKGYLFAGTYSGRIFASPDSGVTWSDASNGLCDSSTLKYPKSIKCIKVTKDDTIHAMTYCGEFVSTVPELHWKRVSNDSCLLQYCPRCLTHGRFVSALGRWMISALIGGPIEWSPDSGETWNVAIPGCSTCGMTITGSVYFDTISALAYLASDYSSRFGYGSGLLMSIDSGRTWRATNFPPIYRNVYAITRIAPIAFAGTIDGIYASRDNFTTCWKLGGSSSVKKSKLPVRDLATGNDRGTFEYTLTGKLLRHSERLHGNQVVIEACTDGTGRYVKKMVSKDLKR
jgi:hypothetical protein